MSVPQFRTVSRRHTQVPGAVIGISILLFFQALGLIALGLALFFSNTWQLGEWPWLETQLAVIHSTNNTVRGLIVIQGLLAFSSAVGLLRLRRKAWVLAVAVQGFHMLSALVLYFSTRPSFIYPIMAYSVFMVLYLNYAAVIDAFPRSQIAQDQGETT